MTTREGNIKSPGESRMSYMDLSVCRYGLPLIAIGVIGIIGQESADIFKVVFDYSRQLLPQVSSYKSARKCSNILLYSECIKSNG